MIMRWIPVQRSSYAAYTSRYRRTGAAAACRSRRNEPTAAAGPPAGTGLGSLESTHRWTGVTGQYYGLHTGIRLHRMGQTGLPFWNRLKAETVTTAGRSIGRARRGPARAPWRDPGLLMRVQSSVRLAAAGSRPQAARYLARPGRRAASCAWSRPPGAEAAASCGHGRTTRKSGPLCSSMAIHDRRRLTRNIAGAGTAAKLSLIWHGSTSTGGPGCGCLTWSWCAVPSFEAKS
jgi:hypothetical protein